MEKLVGFHLSSTYVLPTMFKVEVVEFYTWDIKITKGISAVLPCGNLFTTIFHLGAECVLFKNEE